MGHVYAEITLINSFDATAHKKGLIAEGEIKKMDINVMVDTGAMTLAINSTIADQLGLLAQDQQLVELADGTLKECDLVGPVDVRFKNRKTSCLALVLPDAAESLLGVIPMEGMDVMIDPISQQLILPPDRLERSLYKVK